MILLYIYAYNEELKFNIHNIYIYSFCLKLISLMKFQLYNSSSLFLFLNIPE